MARANTKGALLVRSFVPPIADPRETWRERASTVAHRIYTASAADQAVDRLADDEHLGGHDLPRLPNPRTCIELGTLRDIHVAEIVKVGREWVPTGAIRVWSWAPGAAPTLLWSRTLSAVLAFGGASMGPPVASLRNLDEDVRIFRKWHHYREPFGASRMQMPAPPMIYVGPAIAVVYWSAKRDENGRARGYIHHHDPGVGAWMSKDARGVNGQTAMLLRGGELRISPDGSIEG